MLDALKFVQGAVKRNVIAPELEHYQIKNGRVTGFNGHMALSAVLDLDIEAHPKASTFYKAIQACSGAIALNLTPTGKLSVRSGGFSAYIECLPDMFYNAKPEGTMYPCPAGFVSTLKRIYPFISEDAARPWSMGLLVVDGLYMATNNIVIVQVWDGHTLPRFNFPRFAIAELIRVGIDPVSIQADDSSVSFHYEDGRWIRTQLYSDDWPFDKMSSIFDVENRQLALPEGFSDVIDRLSPFADGPSAPLYFTAGGIGTSPHPEDGIHIALDGLDDGPVFNTKSMELVATVATHADWTLYPRPCLFTGSYLRGAVIGRTA